MNGCIVMPVVRVLRESGPIEAVAVQARLRAGGIPAELPDVYAALVTAESLGGVKLARPVRANDGHAVDWMAT